MVMEVDPSCHGDGSGFGRAILREQNNANCLPLDNRRQTQERKPKNSWWRERERQRERERDREREREREREISSE